MRNKKSFSFLYRTCLPYLLFGLCIFPGCGSGVDTLYNIPEDIATDPGSGYNSSPVISTFSSNITNPHPGQNVTLTVSASDPEGDPITYAYEFITGSGTITGSGETVVVTVNNLGICIIKVTVTDDKGSSATRTLDLTGSNLAPVITSFTGTPGSIFNNSTDTKNLTVTVNDPDGDTLTISYSLLSGNGSITGSMTNTEIFTSGTIGGFSTVRVTVEDIYGDVSTSDLQVKVCGWQQILPSGTSPTARQWHTAIYDDNGNMIVFGGYNGSNFNDVWKYNIAGQAWTDITPASGPAPAARRMHSAVYDGNGNMIIFGGYAPTSQRDVWNFNIAAMAWTDISVLTGLRPSTRASTQAVCYDDGINNYMIFFSGSGSYARDTWSFNIMSPSWTRLSNGAGPPATGAFQLRSGHSAIHDGSGNMIVFGGSDYANLYYNDVWSFDIASTGWTDITHVSGAAPAGRASQSGIYDENGNMVIFGGAMGNSANLANDVWQFDIATQSWTELLSVNSPTKRYQHTAIYYNDGASGYMLVFGGSDGSFKNDLWLYVLP